MTATTRSVPHAPGDGPGEWPWIDGDYDEIVKWMDANPVRKVGHVEGHGERVEIEGEDPEAKTRLNFGLFSICQPSAKGRWDCDFTRASIVLFGNPYQPVVLTKDEAALSHTMTF